jgi:hypothetical protein
MGHVQKKIADQYDVLGVFTIFYNEAQKSVSGNLTFLQLEAILGTKTK